MNLASSSISAASPKATRSIASSRCSEQRQVAAALVSAGGSTIYGLGAPPGRKGWDVTIQDPIDSRKTALTVTLKDRAALRLRQLGEIVRVRRREVFAHHGPAQRPAGAGRAERRGAHEHRDRGRCARQRVLRDGPGAQPGVSEDAVRARKRSSSCRTRRAAWKIVRLTGRR